MSSLKDTLEFILNAIVVSDTPITVDESEDSGTIILTINAPETIIGQLIGKEGKIIKSIRTLLSISHPQQRFLVNFKE